MFCHTYPRTLLTTPNMMKTKHLIKIGVGVVLFLISLGTFAQKYKLITLCPQRNYYLNGGLNATFGGTSRSVIRVDLLPCTEQWYYSFTTSSGSNTNILYLGNQIENLLEAGKSWSYPNLISPPGTGSVEVFVIDSKDESAFLSKDDGNWRYYGDISVLNAKNATQCVRSNSEKSYSIGLRNPSSLDGVTVGIEVVALVNVGVCLNEVGKDAFNKGEFEKCVEYCTMALDFDTSISESRFYIALVLLLQNDPTSVKEYLEAIVSNRQHTESKQVLLSAMQILNQFKEAENNETYEFLFDAIKLISKELEKYY